MTKKESETKVEDIEWPSFGIDLFFSWKQLWKQYHVFGTESEDDITLEDLDEEGNPIQRSEEVY